MMSRRAFATSDALFFVIAFFHYDNKYDYDFDGYFYTEEA